MARTLPLAWSVSTLSVGDGGDASSARITSGTRSRESVRGADATVAIYAAASGRPLLVARSAHAGEAAAGLDVSSIAALATYAWQINEE